MEPLIKVHDYCLLLKICKNYAANITVASPLQTYQCCLSKITRGYMLKTQDICYTINAIISHEKRRYTEVLKNTEGVYNDMPYHTSL